MIEFIQEAFHLLNKYFNHSRDIWRLLFFLFFTFTIFSSTVNATTCFDSTTSSSQFPRVIGGVKSATHYTDVDLSSTGTMVVVGYSSSQDLISSSSNRPFIVGMDSTGSYIFTQRFYAVTNEVFQAVKYNHDETLVFAVTGNSNSYTFFFFSLSATDGTYKLGLQVDSSTIKLVVNHNCIVSQGNMVYIAALQSSSNKARIMGFDSTLTSSQTPLINFETQYSNSNFDTLLQGLVETSNLHAFGVIPYNSNLYWGIVSFSETQTTTTSISIDYTSLLALGPTSSTSFTNQVSYHTNSLTSISEFYLVGQFSSSQLFFWFLQIDPTAKTTALNELYQYDFAEGTVQCQSLIGYQGNMMYAYISTSNSNNNFYFLTVNYQTTYASMIKRKLTNLSGRNNQLVGGVMTFDLTTNFYVLNVKQIPGLKGTDIYLSNYQGAVMIYDYTQSCLTSTESNDLSVNLNDITSTYTQLLTLAQSLGFSIISGKTVKQLTSPPSGNAQLLSTTLISTSWCTSITATIQSTTYTDSYTVYTGWKGYNFNAFTTVEGCTDATFTYQLFNQGSTTTLNSIISFSTGSSTSFSVGSNSESDAGTLTLDIIGTLDQTGASQTGTITLTIINPCLTGTIQQQSSISAFTYYLGDTTTYTMNNYFACTDNTYYLSCQKTWGLFTDSALSTTAGSTIFSINSGSSVLTISNTDLTLHGVTETVYVKIALSSNTAIYQYQQVTVTMNKCKLNTATTPTYNTIYYDEGTTAVYSTFAAWTSTFQTDCGAFVYTVTYDDSTNSNYTTVPSTTNAITYTSSTRTFKIQTSSTSQIGSYLIQIKGQTGTEPFYVTKTQTFNIINMCVLTPPTILAQFYLVNSIPTYSLTHSAFTAPYCVPASTSVVYTLTVTGQSSLPTWLTYSATTRKIAAAPTTNVYKGTYTLNIKGTFYSSYTLKTYTASTSFSLKIVPENTSPPILATAPTAQKVTAGQQLKYSLSSISDPDLDGWSVKADLGQASAFVKFSSPTFSISPLPTNVGTFTITITITDDNPAPLSSQYSFILTVNAAASTSTTSTASNSSNSNTTDTFQGVIISYDLPANATQAQKDLQKQLDLLYQNFGAKIKSINNQGLVIVQFLDAILVPNITFSTTINSSVLNIQAVPGMYSQASDLQFTWNCSSITSYYMYIQLTFNSPLKVSYEDVADSLSIQFIMNGYFIQKSTARAIKYKTQISRTLPKQLDAGGIIKSIFILILVAALLNSVGGSASSSLQSLMMGNLGINIVMSASLQYLWGMINVLQIIINMPLFSVNFPSNALALYSLIISITQFNIFPSSSSGGSAIFNFDNDGALSDTFAELDIFYIPLNSSFNNYKLNYLTLQQQIECCQYGKYVLLYGWYIISHNWINHLQIYIYQEQDLQWDSTSDRFSSFFCIGLIGISIIFPALITFVLYFFFHRLKEPWFQERINSLFENLKETKRLSLMYNQFFLYRRLLFGVSVVVMLGSQYQAFQIYIMYLQSLFLLIYIISVKPFEEPDLNSIEIFNECCILYASYHLMIFTSYVNDVDIQADFGLSLIGVVVLNISINTILMIVKTYSKVKMGLRKALYKYRLFMYNRKLKKAEKYYMNEQDLDAHEGAFINKVYRNLQNRQKLQKLPSYDQDSSVFDGIGGSSAPNQMGIGVAPVKYDFFFNAQQSTLDQGKKSFFSLQQESNEGSPNMKNSLNNTGSNFNSTLNGKNSSDFLNTPKSKFMPVKTLENKNGMMKSLFKYFQQKNNLNAQDSVDNEPQEYQNNNLKKHSSLFDYDKSTNIHDMLQSLEMDEPSQVNNNDFENSSFQQQSNKNLLLSQKQSLYKQQRSSVMNFDQFRGTERGDSESPDKFNELDLQPNQMNSTFQNKMSLNSESNGILEDSKEEDDIILNAPRLEEQKPKQSIFQNVLQQLKMQNNQKKEEDESDSLEDSEELKQEEDHSNRNNDSFL